MKHPKHLIFIRQLPCLLCGDNTSVEAAHIRYSDPDYQKPLTGMGIKPSDEWVIPLCGAHHRLQHSMSEREFWIKQGKDPLSYCKALWRFSGNLEAGEKIIRGA